MYILTRKMLCFYNHTRHFPYQRILQQTCCNCLFIDTYKHLFINIYHYKYHLSRASVYGGRKMDGWIFAEPKRAEGNLANWFQLIFVETLCALINCLWYIATVMLFVLTFSSVFHSEVINFSTCNLPPTPSSLLPVDCSKEIIRIFC